MIRLKPSAKALEENFTFTLEENRLELVSRGEDEVVEEKREDEVAGGEKPRHLRVI